MDQTKMEEGSIETLADGNATEKRIKKRKREKTKVKDEVQTLDQKNMDTRSTEYLAEGSVMLRNPKVQDEVQSKDQAKMDTSPTEIFTDGQVTEKRKKKQKNKAKIKDEVQREMDTRSTEDLVEGNVTFEKPRINDEVQSIGHTKMDRGSTENIAGNLTIKDKKVLDEVQSMDQTKMNTGPMENSAEGNVTGKRKKKQKSKVKINDEVQGNIDTRSTENLVQGNATIEVPKIKDEVQGIGQTKIDAGSKANLAVGVTLKNPKIQDEVRNTDHAKMDTRPTENPAEGNVTGKIKKKRKSKVNINDEVQSNIDNRSTVNLAQGNAAIEMPQIKDEVQSIDLAEVDAGSKENLAERNLSIKNPKIQDEAQSMDQIKIDTVPSENFAEGNVTGKGKKKRKRKATIKDEVQREMDTRSTDNFVQGNVTIEKPKIEDEVQTTMYPGSIEILTEKNVSITNPKIQDETQSMDQIKMGTGASESFADGNVIGKRNKRRKSKPKVNNEVQQEMDTRSAENLAQGNVSVEKPNINYEAHNVEKIEVVPIGDFTEGNVPGKIKRIRRRKRNRKRKAITEGEFISMSQDGSTSNLKCEWSNDSKLGGDRINNCGALARPMELESKLFHCENQDICHPHLPAGLKGIENGLSKVCSEIILDKGEDFAEGMSAISSCEVRVITKDMCAQMAPTTIRRKLLVLDVNGLLADIVLPAPKHCRGDIKICGRAVFKRPFCDDFLKFCFQKFDVGIWSSRSKRIIDRVVSYLLGDQKEKLLFCWDMNHTTQSRFKTLENKHKPLVCKELRKIWDNGDPNLPWKKGDYDESNTLLLDDSPYKALLNPLHTAIFPDSYHYVDKNDDSLGPGGALRVYLEGLVTSENVQKYVEQHPFGQRPIMEESCSWEFYSRVLHQISNPVEGKTPMSNPVNDKTSMSNPLKVNSNPGEGENPMSNPAKGKTPMSNPLKDKTPIPIHALS